MLFNSYIFIFLFLPITITIFYLIGVNGRHNASIIWLVLSSLFFYGWWDYSYLILILISILTNYGFGLLLSRYASKSVLITGVSFNLFLLLYFKYFNFFVDNINIFLANDFNVNNIVLPLAISFFTFQQIAYLVDAYRGETHEYNFLYYCLFVTFFPQLIAGPIVHHKDMIPQFYKKYIYKIKYKNIFIGLAIFFLGLFKKVVLADNISVYADPVFNAAKQGVSLSFFEAWSGSIAYTFQLYFDFSGYSDMAIGISYMFGIILPVNFYSPYKAINIIDFWKRWHITLSRFLRDYLYIPLGGNRLGNRRRYVNLLVTMLLGGLWHGSNWTFIVWGAMHGFYIIINHAWHFILKAIGIRRKHSILGCFFARLLTFFAVVISWVVFRADSVDSALIVYNAMFGGSGLSFPLIYEPYISRFSDYVNFVYIDNGIFNNINRYIILLISMIFVIWFMPNTMEFFKREKPALGLEVISEKNKSNIAWYSNYFYTIFIVIIASASIVFIQKESVFLYFQF